MNTGAWADRATTDWEVHDYSAISSNPTRPCSTIYSRWEACSLLQPAAHQVPAQSIVVSKYLKGGNDENSRHLHISHAFHTQSLSQLASNIIYELVRITHHTFYNNTPTIFWRREHVSSFTAARGSEGWIQGHGRTELLLTERFMTTLQSAVTLPAHAAPYIVMLRTVVVEMWPKSAAKKQLIDWQFLQHN